MAIATKKAAIPTPASEEEVNSQEQETVEQEQSEEEKEEEAEEAEEEKARVAGMDYAKKLSSSLDPQAIESDEDQANGTWLHSMGYAEPHSIQEGVETYNYYTLTQDGINALQAYNSEAPRD